MAEELKNCTKCAKRVVVGRFGVSDVHQSRVASSARVDVALGRRDFARTLTTVSVLFARWLSGRGGTPWWPWLACSPTRAAPCARATARSASRPWKGSPPR